MPCSRARLCGPVREAYREARLFGKALGKRGKGGGFMKNLVEQRICSSIHAGLSTARMLMEGRTLHQEEDDDEADLKLEAGEEREVLQRLAAASNSAISRCGCRGNTSAGGRRAAEGDSISDIEGRSWCKTPSMLGADPSRSNLFYRPCAAHRVANGAGAEVVTNGRVAVECWTNNQYRTTSKTRTPTKEDPPC